MTAVTVYLVSCLQIFCVNWGQCNDFFIDFFLNFFLNFFDRINNQIQTKVLRRNHTAGALFFPLLFKISLASLLPCTSSLTDALTVSRCLSADTNKLPIKTEHMRI